MKNPFSIIWRSLRPKNQLTGTTLENMLRELNASYGTDAGTTVNAKTAQGLAAVGVCYRWLSDMLSSLPLVTYRQIDERRQEAVRELPIFNRLYAAPNYIQTSMQWRKLGVRDLLFRGNWINWKVPESGNSYQLMRLHPDRTEVIVDKASGEVNYKYWSGAGSYMMLPAEEILHFWFDSDDGYTGLNPIEVYRNTIGDGIALREHGSYFFRNAARLHGLIEQSDAVSIDPEDLKALLADFNTLYTGGENAHKTAALPKGFSFKEVSMTMQDSQWIESRKVTSREIYGIYGVPPHKGGDLSDATYSNVEQENIGAVIDSLTPKVTAIEQIINKDLLGVDSGLFVKHTMAALVRGDFKSRQEGLNIMRRAGVINANEWRDIEDMNPRDDEGGEEYIVETNMRPQDGEYDEGNNQGS